MSTQTFEIPKPNKKTFVVEIRGKTGLICHRFSEKSIKMLHEIHTKKPSRGMRPPRTTESIREEYESSVYVDHSGRIGFPAANIKNAMVRAAKNVGLKMTDVKTLFWINEVEDGLIPITLDGKQLSKEGMQGCVMREERS